jgi:SAM-dependent methyltransferase
MPRRISRLDPWPQAFDPRSELDWADPTFSRRLLREHLDQAHDGASRRSRVVERQVQRLRRLLPAPPARILDAGCGPGLYALRLARLGYDVDGIDLGPAVIAHARREARRAGVEDRANFEVADLRRVPPAPAYDAVLLIYYVLENLNPRSQVAALRRLAATLLPGGRLVIELRLRADQPEGRLSAWDLVDSSLLSDRRHLLLTDTTYDPRRRLFVLRETAVFDDGSVAQQQTTSRLTGFDEIPALLNRAGLRDRGIYDGWSRFRGNALCGSVVVVAEPVSSGARSRRRRSGSAAGRRREAGPPSTPHRAGSRPPAS